jgi:hypothetical protein
MFQHPFSKAFAHLRILDLSRVRAGPTCVRQFADFGADVIKIEPPLNSGTDTMMGPRHGSNMQNMHRNKRALTLNIKDARGLDVLSKLVKTADVVVENTGASSHGDAGVGRAHRGNSRRVRIHRERDRGAPKSNRNLRARFSDLGKEDRPYRLLSVTLEISRGQAGFMAS